MIELYDELIKKAIQEVISAYYQLLDEELSLQMVEAFLDLGYIPVINYDCTSHVPGKYLFNKPKLQLYTAEQYEYEFESCARSKMIDIKEAIEEVRKRRKG